MYQNIDDIEAIHSPEETQLPYNDARFWLICLVVFGFSVMLAAAIWKYTQKPAIYIHPSDQPEAAQAFQKIQSETRASLRRARLIDFTQNYPDSPVINGARQQLRVMNDYEAKDWSFLSDIMFSDIQTIDYKRLELERYTTQWGEGLVGSRDADLAAFKSILNDDSLGANIDRRHKPDSSPIPETIDGTRMAGGQVFRPIEPSYPIPEVVIYNPAPIIAAPKVIDLEIRKSKRPEYPRRAYNRGIPAAVDVSYNVDTKGRVVLVRVINVDADRYSRDFERAAKRAARATRYYPKTVDGVPTPVTGITKTYVFDPSR